MKTNWTLIKVLIRIHREQFALNENELFLKTGKTLSEWQALENNASATALELLSSFMELTNFSNSQLFTQERCFIKNIKASHPELSIAIQSNNILATDIVKIYWLIKKNKYLLSASYSPPRVAYKINTESNADDFIACQCCDLDLIDTYSPTCLRKWAVLKIDPAYP